MFKKNINGQQNISDIGLKQTIKIILDYKANQKFKHSNKSKISNLAKFSFFEIQFFFFHQKIMQNYFIFFKT